MSIIIRLYNTRGDMVSQSEGFLRDLKDIPRDIQLCRESINDKTVRVVVDVAL